MTFQNLGHGQSWISPRTYNRVAHNSCANAYFTFSEIKEKMAVFTNSNRGFYCTVIQMKLKKLNIISKSEETEKSLHAI